MRWIQDRLPTERELGIDGEVQVLYTPNGRVTRAATYSRKHGFEVRDTVLAWAHLPKVTRRPRLKVGDPVYAPHGHTQILGFYNKKGKLIKTPSGCTHASVRGTLTPCHVSDIRPHVMPDWDFRDSVYTHCVLQERAL